TGKRLHHGETTTEMLASVMKDEPNWSNIPPQWHRLLHRCLEKDPQKRLRHIGDVMSLVDESPAAAAAVPVQTRRRSWLWASVAAAVVLLGAGVILRAPWRIQEN